MQSFISETLDSILQNTKSFENVVFILPSQRAGVFVKETFKKKISAGFLPEIINIGDFVEEISEMKKIDAVQLLSIFILFTKNKKRIQIRLMCFRRGHSRFYKILMKSINI